MVIRFLHDGARDSGFGTDGVLAYEPHVSSGKSKIFRLAVMDDGGFLAGVITSPSTTTSVTRYTESGTRFLPFGANGILTVEGIDQMIYDAEAGRVIVAHTPGENLPMKFQRYWL